VIRIIIGHLDDRKDEPNIEFLSSKKGTFLVTYRLWSTFLPHSDGHIRVCYIELLRMPSPTPLIARHGMMKAKRTVVKQKQGNNLG
jgi:hypothetical protein